MAVILCNEYCMRHHITTPLKELLVDRPLLLLSIAILLLGITYILYVGFSLSPTELQIATRFSAFSDAQFYRNKWYYLISFVGFGALLSFVHVALIAKIKSRGMRPLAFAFGGVSIFMIILAFLWTYSVLDIAYLS